MLLDLEFKYRAFNKCSIGESLFLLVLGLDLVWTFWTSGFLKILFYHVGKIKRVE